VRGNLGSRNNTIQLKDDSFAIVHDIICTVSNDIQVIVQKFSTISNFFDSLLDSMQIGIYQLDQLSDLEMIPGSLITKKDSSPSIQKQICRLFSTS